MPGADHRIGFRHAAVECSQLHRQHHQNDVGEKADGIDAVRQRRAVIALFLGRKTAGQQGVSHIADQQADTGGGEDLPKQQGIGVAQHATAEADDQQDLNQVVQAKGEKAIHIARPPWPQQAL